MNISIHNPDLSQVNTNPKGFENIMRKYNLDKIYIYAEIYDDDKEGKEEE